MKNQTLVERISFFAGVAIGGIGAVGQAVILHNYLVHSYPFKMMNVPPWDFYERIGQVGIYMAPVVAIAFTLLLGLKKKFLSPMIPVIVCPLVFWFLFEIAFLASPYRGELMREVNFEGYTGETARYLFGFTVLSLLVWGAAIGFIASLLISIVSKFFPTKLANDKKTSEDARYFSVIEQRKDEPTISLADYLVEKR